MSEIYFEWLRDNKDLYKREAMARKLHIGEDTLNQVIENKKVSPHSIERIKQGMIKLLLHNNELVFENNIVMKLYILAMVDKYKKLPWLDVQKEQIYDDLETLQKLFIKYQHPLCLFINSEVSALAKGVIVENKEKAGIAPSR